MRPGVDLLIDLAQGLRSIGAFHAHQHVKIGRLATPVATRKIGLVVSGDTL